MYINLKIISYSFAQECNTVVLNVTM